MQWTGEHPSAAHALALSVGALLGFGPLLGIPAIVTGTRVLREVAADPVTYTSAGRSRAAIVIGWLGIYVWPAFLLEHLARNAPGLPLGMLVCAGVTGAIALLYTVLPWFRRLRRTFHPLGLVGLALALALGAVRPTLVARAERTRIEAAARSCEALAGEALQLASTPGIAAERLEYTYYRAELACREAHDPLRAEAMERAKRLHAPAAIAKRERERAEEAAKPKPPPEGPFPAAQLVEAYRRDFFTANPTFKDATVQLLGKAGPVRKGPHGDAYLVIGTQGTFEADAIHCYLLPAEIAGAGRLPRGATVLVGGTVTGPGPGTNIVLRECWLPKAR